MTFPFRPATLLAPMEGVSHPLFRAIIAAQGGVGVLCTEFVRISRAPIGADAVKRHVIKTHVPLLVQLMGNEEGDMGDAAATLAAAGADVVDINMGCPTKRASKNGVGAAMLKDPELVTRVVTAMRRNVPGLISVKMRAGFDDAQHVLHLAKRIEDAGADFITIHPRLRSDQYRGVADWRIITRIKEAVKIPVVGNGDIWYAADALRMRRETGCDAVMIGRPAIRNPWIFRQIAQLERGEPVFRPSGRDLVTFIQTTATSYSAHFGPRALGMMKEMVRYCGRAIPDGNDTVRVMMRSQTLDALVETATAHIADIAELDLGPEGYLERSGYAQRCPSLHTLTGPR